MGMSVKRSIFDVKISCELVEWIVLTTGESNLGAGHSEWTIFGERRGRVKSS